jgi:hypothetical protein
MLEFTIPRFNGKLYELISHIKSNIELREPNLSFLPRFVHVFGPYPENAQGVDRSSYLSRLV